MHPLEPAESPTLSAGHKIGHHRIQGISDEFVPPIIHFDELDDVVQANDGDAILMAQLLAQHGLAVGISSGANVIGALRVQQALGPDAIVVTVLCDSNKKYLSTDLLRSEPVEGRLPDAAGRDARLRLGESGVRNVRRSAHLTGLRMIVIASYVWPS